MLLYLSKQYTSVLSNDMALQLCLIENRERYGSSQKPQRMAYTEHLQVEHPQKDSFFELFELGTDLALLCKRAFQARPGEPA